MQTPHRPKYFLYARKSEEGEDRQIASIGDQVAGLRGRHGHCTVVDVLAEERSAKAPGRPVLNSMLERIKKGEADGIICWSLNRLARNPIDGGEIMWLLQRGVIRHIQTYERSYYPGDNVLLMSVEFGMANQFIQELSRDTKRGLQSKAKEGWYPGKAPLGYQNTRLKEKRKNAIVVDPERFALVRRLWDALLTGEHTVPQIRNLAVEEWGLTAPRSRRPISVSRLYDMYRNPFYCGAFRYAGELYDGKHRPMVTKAEFARVQELLPRTSKTRYPKNTFAFAGGLIRCGECGASITAESKTKRQKNGNVHRYTYYRCARNANASKSCAQPYVRGSALVRQIADMLGQLEIPHEFYVWATDMIRKEHRRECRQERATTDARHAEERRARVRIETLLDMRLAEEISQSEFAAKKRRLQEALELLRIDNAAWRQRTRDWLEYAEGALRFAQRARVEFEKGDEAARRDILRALGSNFVLTHRKLSLVTGECLALLTKSARRVRRIHRKFEPVQGRMDTGKLRREYVQDSVVGRLARELRNLASLPRGPVDLAKYAKLWG